MAPNAMGQAGFLVINLQDALARNKDMRLLKKQAQKNIPSLLQTTPNR